MPALGVEWQLVFSLLVGIGLSAACGLRLFIPPLVLSAAGLYFHMPLPQPMHWLASDTAFFILLAATLFEIGAYYVPWLDNLLDNVATPAAVVAGTLITSPFVSQLDPVWQWTLALVAGGTVAGAVQSLTHGARLTSALTTAGLANPLVATVENVLSLALSVTAIVFPVLTIIILLLVAFLAIKAYRALQRYRTPAQPPARR